MGCTHVNTLCLDVYWISNASVLRQSRLTDVNRRGLLCSRWASRAELLRITSHTCVACVCVAVNTLLVSYSASRISFALGCVRIPQEQRGGRRQGFCQDNRIGNMALFCLFHIRGNNVLECGDEKEPSATRRISAH